MTAGLRGAIESGRFAVTAELDLAARHRPGPGRRQGQGAVRLGGRGQRHRQPRRQRDARGDGRLGAGPAGRAGAGDAAARAGTATGSRCRPTCSAPGCSASPTCCCSPATIRASATTRARSPCSTWTACSWSGAARTLRDSGRLLGGRTVSPPPSWLIGAVENPFAAPQRFRAERLGKKIAAGAEFVQTQFVFDVPMFARFMADVRDLGLTDAVHVLAGIGPIRSLRALELMRAEVPGMYIPDDVVRRLSSACRRTGSRPRACALCAEIDPAGQRDPGRRRRARHGLRLGGPGAGDPGAAGIGPRVRRRPARWSARWSGQREGTRNVG